MLFVTEGSTYVANLFRTQMRNEFKTLDTYLYGTVNNSADFTVLDDNQRDTNFYISMVKSKTPFKIYSLAFPESTGYLYILSAQTLLSIVLRQTQTIIIVSIICRSYLRQPGKIGTL